ncbi:uL15 family ribosomal protein [Candidatus Micrarchaeota archaeon]|nr:uL15 family ribosomal protein [Candidatus Micrarchaeota archaeon]
MRRLRSPKRKYAGHRTFGAGNKKKRRGKGRRGGRGRAGYHKHKWTRTAKYELEEIRRQHTGFNTIYKKTPVITLEQIARLTRSGKAEKHGDAFTVSFPRAKVIGSTPLGEKVNVSAKSFSKGARQAIEKTGGTATSIVTVAPVRTPVATKAEAKK